MGRRFFALCMFLCVGAMPVLGQASKPLPAKTLLDAAMKKAKAAHKPIFVVFDASW